MKESGVKMIFANICENGLEVARDTLASEFEI